MIIEINKVIQPEIDDVMLLIKNVIAEMYRSGIYQWDAVYPDKNVMLDDITTGGLYALRREQNIAGIITLNEKQTPAYQDLSWADPSGYPLMVHRLCIHPSFQGQGLGKQLMGFAENYARENKYSSIRLDTFNKNEKANGLYRALNYQSRGIVTFRNKDFCCYEKLL